MYNWDIIEPPTCRKWNAYSLIKYAQDHYDTDPGLDENMIDLSFVGTVLEFDSDGKIIGETTKELLSSDEFIRLIKSKYFTYKFLTPFYLDYSTNKYIDSTDDENYSNVTMAYRQLYQVWQIWAKDNKKNFGDLYNALFQKYNPINNYDKHSNITLDYKGGEKETWAPSGTETTTFTPKGSESDTNVRSGSYTDNETISGKEKTTHHNEAYDDTTQVSSFDSGSEEWLNKEKNSHSKHDDYDETEYGVDHKDRTNNRSVTYSSLQDASTKSFSKDRIDETVKKFSEQRKDETTKEFTNRKDETNEYTFGNIGVTTTQQMAMSSFDLAELAHLKEYIVNDFVNRCLEL